MSISPEIRTKIKEKLENEHAKSIAIFGSYIQGEDRPDSDIDILVEFSVPKSLFDMARIERQLSEDIGIKVDLVTEKSLSPYMRRRVDREKEVLT